MMKEKIKELKEALEKERLATNLFIIIVCFSIITLLVILNFVYTSNPYDVNRDGKVTSADYIEIINYIMEVQNEN